MTSTEISTEQKILTASLELFTEKGYKATTTRSIAEKAGVNEVTIFRKFRTKDNLFREMLVAEAADKMQTASTGFKSTGDMIEDLTRLGLWMQKNMYENAPLLKLLMMEVSNRPDTFEIVGQVPFFAIGRLSEFFEEAKKDGRVRPDADTELAALMFFSFMFRSLVSRAFLGEDVFIEMSEETVRGIAELTVKGIGGGSA